MSTTPDPSDGRKSVVVATPAGRQHLESMLESRDTWLVHAVESRIAPHELAALETTIDLLERLAQEDRG